MRVYLRAHTMSSMNPLWYISFLYVVVLTYVSFQPASSGGRHLQLRLFHNPIESASLFQACISRSPICNVCISISTIEVLVSSLHSSVEPARCRIVQQYLKSSTALHKTAPRIDPNRSNRFYLGHLFHLMMSLFNKARVVYLGWLEGLLVLHFLDTQTKLQGVAMQSYKSLEGILEAFLECWGPLHLGLARRMHVEE